MLIALTSKEKARALFAIDLLESHRASLDAALKALREAQASAAHAELAMESARAFIAECVAKETAYVRERLASDNDASRAELVLAVDPSWSTPHAVAAKALTPVPPQDDSQ